MADWIIQIMERLSYAGIALLMFLENVIPPIPSEVIMPLAGFTAKQGQMSLTLAILAGTGGSLLGTTMWYWLAWKLGERRLRGGIGRYGRWIGMTEDELDRANDWFRRWQRSAVVIGRLIPGVRTFISIPAGFTHMPFVPFLLYSLAGTAVWTAVLAGAGWLLGQHYTQVQTYLGPIGMAVIAGIILWIVIRIWQRRQTPSHQPHS